MGNPCRYIFENEHWCRHPVSFEDRKQIQIDFLFSCPEATKFGTAIVDFYSAPDVIHTYKDGDSNKDEFAKYWKWEFTDLEEISRVKHDIWENGQTVVYSYKEVKLINYEGLDVYRNVMLGKFSGLSEEGINLRLKKRNNLFGPFIAHIEYNI